MVARRSWVAGILWNLTHRRLLRVLPERKVVLPTRTTSSSTEPSIRTNRRWCPAICSARFNMPLPPSDGVSPSPTRHRGSRSRRSLGASSDPRGPSTISFGSLGWTSLLHCGAKPRRHAGSRVTAQAVKLASLVLPVAPFVPPGRRQAATAVRALTHLPVFAPFPDPDLGPSHGAFSGCARNRTGRILRDRRRILHEKPPPHAARLTGPDGHDTDGSQRTGEEIPAAP